MPVRPSFIDLDRRFRELTDQEREDPEVLAAYGEHDIPWSEPWAKLLEHPRAVILAEAGAGKTREMREQADRMLRDGRPAFFMALESLQSENPRDLLSPDERKAYDGWLADDQSVGWFFLDAVDELKLVHGTLPRALRRLANAIDGRLGRARIILSSRPTDWRPINDLDDLQTYLPVPDTRALTASADDLFLEALRKGNRGGNDDSEDQVKVGEAPRIVTLLPLGEKQITRFVQQAGIKDSDRFLEEVRRRDAWTFARRPLDLGELVLFWREHDRLGARAEQHETNIRAKLKDDPGRADHGVLSDDKARVGAERLALALEFTRSRTIRAPERAVDTDVAASSIDAADVLMDWTEAERQALLRRALFDPATYGRVRFHHRSVQEYLAAKRLMVLRGLGMTAQALRRLLFAERYGVEVVLPATKALAAWVGLWDDDIRNELMRREPEVLLTLGDPESLSPEARTGLLRAFTDSYGTGGDRGLNIPIGEVRRLAHPDLAPVIAELWAKPALAPDVKELLLELIWQGAIEPCAPIAAAAAEDASLPTYERTISVRALAACGRKDLLAPIAAAMLDQSAPWPPTILHGSVHDLFPTYWSAGDLRRLIARTPEPRNTVGGFSWALRNLALSLDPAATSTVRLRNAMAALIWTGRRREDSWYEHHSQFGYLAIALANLCLRALAQDARLERSLLRACVIAHRYGHDGYGGRDEVSELKAAFRDPGPLRQAAFWLEVELSLKLARADGRGEQAFRAEHHSLVEPLGPEDRPWLMDALANSAEPDHRAIALEALQHLWWRSGSAASELMEMTKAVADDETLATRLAVLTAPRPRNPVFEEHDRRMRRSKQQARRREQQRIKRWTTWRDGLLADPNGGFTPTEVVNSLANLYSWLRQASRGRSSYNLWDRSALAQAYTPEIAQLAADAFRAYWRANPVTPFTQRPAEERNGTPWGWMWGLTGLAAEAESHEGWASRLTVSEAETASGYALAELNGFPHWADDLARHQPAAFDAVVGCELSAQLALVGALAHLPLLQDVHYASAAIKQLVAPRVQRALAAWPTPPDEEQSAGRAAYHLDNALDIVLAANDPADRPALIVLCEQGFRADPMGPYSVAWLKALLQLSGTAGALIMEEHLAGLPNPDADRRAIALLAALFGDPGGTALRFEDTASKVETLERLIRLAYRHVREADDNRHDGVFTPDERDQAERGRGFLISTLFETPGPEARTLILKLADDPLFADWPDRMRMIARNRAAKDAEGPRLTTAEITVLEARLEAPPHDRDTLHQVMLDRLSDLAHDLAHDDFSDRRTLLTITDESEMQRSLAGRLRAMAKSAYVVVREDEVADQKRTDIRLAAMDHKAVIEVKLADKRWSYTDLERALRDQLVGQYLRHRHGRSGCLLLVYDGTKQRWTHGGRRMNFEQMVERLQQLAREIEAAHGHDLRVTVRGLDLRDQLAAR